MSHTSEFSSLFGLSENGIPNIPRPYQDRLATLLKAKRNVVLTSPTGTGKTMAVLAPFLAFRKEMGVSRLIYCLPMRTLALGIFAEAQAMAKRATWPARVTLQTGDHPGDPFFHDGDIIVCTFDQLLSVTPP